MYWASDQQTLKPVPNKANPQYDHGIHVFYGKDEKVFNVRIYEPRHQSCALPESLVHDIWQYQRFERSALKTTNDKCIKVIHPGKPNLNSGPDFLHAHLIIDGLEWIGSVEIHVHSRDWYSHKHHQDTLYNNTILHISLFDDKKTGSLAREDGSRLPEAILYPLLHRSIQSLLYNQLTQSISLFPCQSLWRDVPLTIKTEWIESLAFTRMNNRIRDVSLEYLQTPDYEKILHQKMFKGLGYEKNSESMQELARRIPLAICRELDTTIQLEALHFGVAGLLPEAGELTKVQPDEKSYIELLKTTFLQLQHEYAIPTMPRNAWLFFRLRPANFPTLRIAQAISWLRNGALLHHDPIGQLQAALSHSPDDLRPVFATLQTTPSSYWDHHFQFLKKASHKIRYTGKARLKKLLINSVAPILLCIAYQNSDPVLEERIWSILRKTPTERDHIIKRYTNQGFRSINSVMSQGLHELYSAYCKPKKCLNCKIGKHLIHNKR